MNPILIDFGFEYDRYETIISAIVANTTKVVSFDIFDTLIMRLTYYPNDIFVMLGNEFKHELTSSPFCYFKYVRISAESNARNDFENGEVTLSGIYQYMAKHYHIDQDLVNKMMQRECEIEYDMSVCRNTGKDLYDIAELHGKQIVYSSDMYLPAKVILSFLEKSGYSTENQIFLSNEIKASKYCGNLYQYALEKLEIAPSQMVHIGDNYDSDVINAEKFGIRAFHLPNAKDLFDRDVKGDLEKLNTSYADGNYITFIGIRAMFAIVANKLFDFPFYHKVSAYQCSFRYIGYYALGMHLYAFTSWLVDQSENVNCLHFVARDGYLPMRAYNTMVSIFQCRAAKTNYIYSSRKFLYSLAMREPKDFIASINYCNTYSHSISKMLSYFPKNCINVDVYSKISKDDLNQPFGNIDTLYKNIPLISQCINFKKLKQYHQMAKNYFSALIKPGDKLVDIGYNGTTEAIFSELLGYPVGSLYLCADRDDLMVDMKRYGFKTRCFYKYRPRVMGAQREFPFMKDDPSLLGINFVAKKPALIFSTSCNNKENTVAVLNTLQTNALSFLADFCHAYKNHREILMFTNELASLPWENFINHAAEIDLLAFKDILLDNDIASRHQTNLFDVWKAETCPVSTLARKESKIKRIANKIFPVGTKRRKFVKKCVNFFLPVGSKRRSFVKKVFRIN